MRRVVVSCVLVFLVLSTSLLTLSGKAASGTVRVPQDFATIQQAIDASPSGSTILVSSGTYYENITVWKSLTIIGQNPSTTTIYQIGALAVCHITADGANFSGFTVRGGSIGIWIDASDHNWIWNNTVVSNDDGIWITFSLGSLLQDNTVSGNLFMGLYLSRSNDTTLSHNIVADNTYGIYMEYSRNDLIEGSTLASNYADAIYMDHMQDSNVSQNILKFNDGGIGLHGSSGYSVFHNDFVNNTLQAYVQSSVGNWDHGYPSGGNYWKGYKVADSHFGAQQNNAGGDGIGDIPYVIDGNNRDNYPLMSPYEYWSSPIHGDVNKDMKVDMGDIATLLDGFGSTLGASNYFWHRPPCILCPHAPNLDTDGNQRIDMGDINTALDNFGKSFHYSP